MRNYKLWFASLIVGLLVAGISERAFAGAPTVTAERGGSLPPIATAQVALTAKIGSVKSGPQLEELTGNMTYIRHVSNVDGSTASNLIATDVPPGSGFGVVGAGERALYSNVRGTFLFRHGIQSPNRSFPISDDLGSDALDVCDLQKYRVAVNGGVVGGGGTFRTLVSLWTGCPTPAGEGTKIPGTQVTFSGLDNNITTTHVLEFVLNPQDMIQVSGTVWLRVQFDSGEAGTIMGSPPDVGFSADAFGNVQACETNLGGFPLFPHGSFNAELIGLDTCTFGFLAYQAALNLKRSFNGGANVRYADDVQLALGESFCELAVLEIGMVGGAGAYTLDVDFRQLGDAGPLPGTSQTFAGKGDLSLETARFEYPAGIFIPNQDLFVTWEPTRGSTGPVIVARNQAGFSATTFSRVTAGGWIGPLPLPPPDNELPAIFSIKVKCRGDAPLGACCPTQTPNEPVIACATDADCPSARSCAAGFCSPVECLDNVPVTACFGGRWQFGVTCADNTFVPPCGTHACCKPDNQCSDEFFDDCILITDPDSPIETCTQDSDCVGGNRTCETSMGTCNDNSSCMPGQTCPDGLPCQRICSARTAQWQPGDFCGFNFQQCPIFECFFGEGNCFESQNSFFVCNSNADCPVRQSCGAVPFNVCTTPRGCDNFKCCDAVCRTPGFFSCCDVGWDESCASVAQSVCSDNPPSNDQCFERRCSDIGFFCTDAAFCQSHAYGNDCLVDPLRGAIPIALDSSNSGNENAFTGNATDDNAPALCCSSHGFSDTGAGPVWFQVVVPAGETSMRASTCLTAGSPIAQDSIIQVLRVGNPVALDKKQQCDSLETLGCNDDYPSCGGGALSDLCLSDLVPGETLFIEVAGASGDFAGTYRLDVEFPCPRIGNGGPDAAPANDTCNGAQDLPAGQAVFSVPFNLDKSTIDCPRPITSECTAMVNDVWFSYFATCTGVLFLDTCDPVASNTDPATVLAAYRSLSFISPCPPDTFLGCNNDAIPNAIEHLRRPQTCSKSLVDCDDDSDCLQPARCEMGNAVCSTDADCDMTISGDVCIPDICQSSCSSGSTLMVPVTAGGRYRIQVGGEFGAVPSGMLNVECMPQDCQQNFLSDLGEIQAGTSLDCNSNSIPDECDIDVNSSAPGGPFFCTTNCESDCDNNGIPDVCDLANGTLTDVAPMDGIPDECVGGCPDGTVTFDSPTSGTIDARQPHPIGDNTAPQGFNMFVVTAPAGAEDPACWSLCETSARNFTPNAIASVVSNGDGTVTLTLNRGITGGEVTRIAYTSGSNVVTTGTFIAHPGNVNGDSVTNSSDITALVDALNGVTPRPFYRTDLDRGGVFNSSDLIRLIDLLNGANAFGPWLNTAKPAGTCTP